MTVTQLPSAASRRAEDNLARFIAKARTELKPYGDVDWDAITWDVTAFEKKRGGQSRKTFRIMFNRLDPSGGRLIERKEAFEQPFADFVRAVIVHRQESQPKTALNQMITVRACRYLYEALDADDHDPARLTLDHFIRAIAHTKEREEMSSAYRVGVALAEVAATVDGYGLARTPIMFQNPIPRNNHEGRVDAEAVRRSKEKLPTEAALNGLAQIANVVSEGPDVIRMRAIELLVAGGFRINELLSIPADCLVERPAMDPSGKPMLDANGQQVIDVGIRYWPEKGGQIDIKWVSTPMADGVRRAIGDLRRLTQDARTLAEWLWTNPGKAWLPSELDGYAPDDLIPLADLVDVFGLADNGSAIQWCGSHGVERTKIGRSWSARRRDIEAALLRLQPSGPMVVSPVRQELHESLFVCFRNEMHSEKGTNRCVITTVTDQNISDVLVGRNGQPTLFERHGITEDDGGRIKLTSHMFRHWLNTLAQEGGMSQHEIARWMGRRRIEDNAAYDHTSGIQMAENARELFRKGEVVGGLKDLYDKLPIAEREGFLQSQIRTAHTTAYGMCMNDWSLLPCVKHGKCLDCGELLVEKGNNAQCQETQRILDEATMLLKYAQQEETEGTFGANNFVDHNRRMVAGAARALAIHADASIPTGTMVHLNPGACSLYQILEQGVEPINESEINEAVAALGGDDDFSIFNIAG
jgi:hypothetical protein